MSTTNTIRMVIGIMAVIFSGFAVAGGNADTGKALYAAQCTSCHGADGKGDGAAAAALTPKPRNLTDKAFMKTLSDQQLGDVLKKGGAAVGKSPMMPASSLKDDQIPDMVAYLRALSK